MFQEVILDAQDTIHVGNTLIIKIKPKGLPKGDNVALIYLNSWGTQIKNVLVADIIKDTSLQLYAGRLAIRAVYNGRALCEKDVIVIPDKTAEPMSTYLGAKSIIANGRDWAMITAIPIDKYGNLVADNTIVDFEFLRADNKRQFSLLGTSHGIAWQKIIAHTVAGKTFVGVSVDSISSREKELLEVADFPQDFHIYPVYSSPYADGRQIFRIKTDVLKDRYGNISSEGTLVTFRCTDVTGAKREFSSYTIGGIAELVLQNPVTKGEIQIIASVFGGGFSNLLKVNFLDNLTNFPVWIDSTKMILKIGPLVGKLNQYLPNGTKVQLSIDYGQLLMSDVNDGYTSFDIRNLSSGTHLFIINVSGSYIYKEFKIR